VQKTLQRCAQTTVTLTAALREPVTSLLHARARALSSLLQTVPLTLSHFCRMSSSLLSVTALGRTAGAKESKAATEKEDEEEGGGECGARA
jgi:hypothetical protein